MFDIAFTFASLFHFLLPSFVRNKVALLFFALIFSLPAFPLLLSLSCSDGHWINFPIFENFCEIGKKINNEPPLAALPTPFLSSNFWFSSTPVVPTFSSLKEIRKNDQFKPPASLGRRPFAATSATTLSSISGRTGA